MRGEAAAVTIDAIHGVVLSWGLEFRPAKGQKREVTAHYGPEGHRGDKLPRDIVFQIGVNMTLDIPKGVVKCGELIGKRFPPKGPVAGMPIDWDTSGFLTLLRKHGTVLRQDTKTNSKGLAVLHFRTFNEPKPGFGVIKRASGPLLPRAKLFTFFGNDVGGWNELAKFPTVLFGWTIEWHEPALTLNAEITHDLSARQAALAGSPGAIGASNYTVRARDVPLTPDASGQLSGETPLEVISFRQDPYEPLPGCRGLTGNASVTTRAPFRVSLVSDPDTGRPGPMQLYPGEVDFYAEDLMCDPVPPNPCCIHVIGEHHSLEWDSIWDDVLGADGSQIGPPTGTIDDWDVIGPGPERDSGVIARKTIDDSNSPVGLGKLHAVLTLKIATPLPSR
jgi:hypothetical protein